MIPRYEYNLDGYFETFTLHLKYAQGGADFLVMVWGMLLPAGWMFRIGLGADDDLPLRPWPAWCRDGGDHWEGWCFAWCGVFVGWGGLHPRQTA